jgi:hypothetical protein
MDPARSARRQEMSDDQVMRAWRACTEGTCACKDERTVKCQGIDGIGGCGAALHAECVGGKAGMILRCMQCRVRDLEVEGCSAEQMEGLRQEALESSAEGFYLSAKTAGARGTAERWVQEMEAESGIQNSTATSAGLVKLGKWILRNRLVVPSTAEAYVRAAAKLGRSRVAAKALVADEQVQEFFSSAKEMYGTAQERDTPAQHEVVLSARQDAEGAKTPLTGTRDVVVIDGTYVGAMRIGEPTGGGAGNDWLAPGTRLFKDRTEIRLSGAKGCTTAQFVTMPAVTLGSQTQLQGALRKLCRQWGMVITDKDQNGEPLLSEENEPYERIDYECLRLNLECLSKEEIEGELREKLREAPGISKEEVDPLIQAALERRQHGTVGARFLVVADGTGQEVDKLEAWWGLHGTRKGKGRWAVRRTGGAVLRATRCQGSKRSKMPVSSATMAGMLKTRLTKAHELSRGSGRGHSEWRPIKLASHSMRRGADQKAQALRGKSGASEEEIDLHFRWRIKELDSVMQKRYEGRKAAEARLRVTLWF